jgi:hypothetical protein
MRSIPIEDGDAFHAAVESHSGPEWPKAMHLADETGILAGRDGAGSRGIYCERCRFGFRRDFGPFPMIEARTSLSHDFTDEAHRRECSHWKAYLEHPQAFARPQPVPDAARCSKPGGGRCVCSRCSTDVSVLFQCLGASVCYRCLTEVLEVTSGYRGLKALMTVEPAPDPKSRRLRRDPAMGRCRTCRAFGRIIPVKGHKYCRPCATAKIEKILAAR